MYVRYSLVDSKTNIPVNLEPAYNGPKIPEGVSYLYRDSYNNLYGEVFDISFLTDYVYQITDTELLETVKSEYLKTLRVRKDYLLSFCKTKFAEVSVKELIRDFTNLKFPRYFDFSSGVFSFTKDEYLLFLEQVEDYEQKVLGWFFEFNNKINAFEEVESLISFFEENIYKDFIGDSDVS